MEAYDEAPYLLTRRAAAIRYSLSEKELDRLCRQNPAFPSLKVGRKRLIHRDNADAFFTRNIREVIEVD